MSRLVLGNLEDLGAGSGKPPRSGSVLLAAARPILRKIAKRKAREAAEEGEVEGRVELSPSSLPSNVIQMFAHPIAKEPERTERTDQPDQPDPVAEEAAVEGFPLTFYGYDSLGAILIDSDGKRVEI